MPRTAPARIARLAPVEERGAALRRRALRATRRGEARKAIVALRELVALEGRAIDWVRLGHALRGAGRPEESLRAYHQGLYAHRRAGAGGRALTVARLILAEWPLDAQARAAAGTPHRQGFVPGKA